MVPAIGKAAGKYIQIFEAYYKQVDPKGSGAITAADAANFLKKSGLSDVALSRIWDLSDPNGRGFLDKNGLFVALKLIALAQAGHDIRISNIYMDIANPPKVGEIPKTMPSKIQNVPPSGSDWSINQMDRFKYDQLFDSLKPVDGFISGANVKRLLMDSKLPLETLHNIWDLADQDKDGNLDRHEFIVAMHLVYQALDKRAVPTSLPPELQKTESLGYNRPHSADQGFVANFPTDIAPPPIPPLPTMSPSPMSQIITNTSNIELHSNSSLVPPIAAISPTKPLSNWVVSGTNRSRFDLIFADCDSDKDGLVSGGEVRDIFLKSGIPQICLAQIWSLSDTFQNGKLTSEQFALAMWLVERKKAGIDPPEFLAPDMIPPSLRDSAIVADSSFEKKADPQPTYSNPELEMISKEIDELVKERKVLELEVAQRETDIRSKTTEVSTLQDELDSLVATLKQLEQQKSDAEKRLEELKDQVSKIKEECQKQEETIREQEGELDSKRSELQKLKDEETALEIEYEKNKNELSTLSKNLQDTQLEICQIKALVTQLEESARQMNDAVGACKTAIETNEPNSVSTYSLKLDPDFRGAKKALEDRPAPDPFNDKCSVFDSNASNEFKSDTFATAFEEKPQDISFNAGFGDSFLNSFPSVSKSSESVTPQGNQFAFFEQPKATSNNVSPFMKKEEVKGDPFAILHAPTSTSQIISPSPSLGQSTGQPLRMDSPGPALPPKKSKQPPPRPAPPKNMISAVNKPVEPDFGGQTFDAFADFSKFDNKNTTVPDFSEDPFKDYRYEDPFAIQDPFDDNADVFATGAYQPKKELDNNGNHNNNKNTNYPETIDNHQSNQVNNTNNNNKTSNFANFDEFVTNETDFFAAFNDNFNKPKNKTDVKDAFAFNNNETKHMTTLIKAPTTKISSKSTKKPMNDEFDKAFGVMAVGKTKESDKFGFDDGFADFGQFDARFATSTTVAGAGPLKKYEKNGNEKLTKTNSNATPKNSRFTSDYSKTDQFEDDLKAAIKRSLVDQ